MQYPPSYLTDILYGVEPMTREIALHARNLRVEQSLSYEEVGVRLVDHPCNVAVHYQIGRGICDLAAQFLNESQTRKWH
jgi:hypothetical protein